MNAWEKPGMTPEERARLVERAWVDGALNTIEQDIAILASAIRAAVEQEREACAEIGDRIASECGAAYKGERDAKRRACIIAGVGTANVLAEAIRARTEEVFGG